VPASGDDRNYRTSPVSDSKYRPPAAAEALAGRGGQGAPAQWDAYLKTELARYTKIIRDAHIKPE
jgi:hypothetical protein